MGRPDDMRDVCLARVPVVTEAELAEHLRARGRRVVEHRSRWWRQIVPGFYRPVHDMARLTAREATRPTAACWGYQACLADDDAGHANAAVPAHVISDLAGFDEAALPKTRRHALRKVRERAELVELTGPAVLHDQGYEVLRSAHERTGYGRLPSREEFLADLAHLGEPASGVVLAGIVDGRLGGYLTGHAVDGTAYATSSVVATWALRANLGTGLHHEFLHACRRAGGITEVVDGLHAREDEGLCRHKELLGVPLRRLPARLVMVPGATTVIRRRSPDKYYRLSGRG
ncbi:conserved protein of unknown function [Modestobacter italicus]|uniref:BioF2-like acetyltransferase domain-containing protein n=1 Tax=Modestobacter italicus (strain DSM 44449 / CECT 9708 / BC 501) TaxID=2732864 RepID=I4EXJ5_MODI5|nr:GNAT family N-acetyltransferase [Modestobacter marinus]CCH88108.1 conserved protein of unknown function [Modestobacter marinus]